MADEDPIRKFFDVQASGPDPIEAFARSAISAATTEFVGLPPDPVVAQIRRDSPWLGVASQLAGLVVPYAGWAKAARIGKFGKAVEGIKVGGAVRTAAVREIARFAPLEVGRVGAAAAVGGDVEGVSWEAAINLGLFGGLSGASAMFRTAGPPMKNVLREGTSGLDLRDPIQIQIRKLVAKRAEAGLSPERQLNIERAIERLSGAVRAQTPAKGQPFVGDLSMGGNRTKINRLFSFGERAGINLERKRLFAGGGFASFDTGEQWRAAISKFGLPENFEGLVQFPVYIVPKTSKGRRIVADSLDGMNKVGDGWLLTREVNDGLFVMARVRKPPGRSTPEMIMFKTDTPAAFVKRPVKAWADKITKLTAEWPDVLPQQKPGATLFNESLAFRQAVPAVNYLEDAANGKIIESTMKRLGGRPGQRAYSYAKEFLTPTAFQFASNSRARWIYGNLKHTFDRASARIEATLFGRPFRPTKRHNLFADIFEGVKFKGGPIHMLDDMSEDEVASVWRAWRYGVGPKEAEAMGVSQKAVEFLRFFDDYDRRIVGEIAATEAATGGARKIQAVPQQFQIARTWRGDHRARVLNEEGKLVYMASGHKPKEAYDDAQRIIEIARDDGKRWTIGQEGTFLADRSDDVAGAATLAVNSPDFRLAQRYRSQDLASGRTQAVKGEAAPWTKEELKKILSAQVQAQHQYIADRTARSLLSDQMSILQTEDPAVYRALKARFDDYGGRPGVGSQWQNRVVDRMLGDFLGKNSATKIVSAANGVMFDLMLGMGNLGFIALNAVTTLHTTLPHVAFVLKAPYARAARHYTWLPLPDSSGRVVGQVGRVEPLKLIGRAFKEMGKPDAALEKAFLRAGHEGVWDPRFVEEFVGQSSKAVLDMKGALSSVGGFAQWIRGLSQWGPAQSEKFARGHSFVTGHILGRDFMGMEGEQLYQFAREFTEKTMFLYATADRARIITGPLGSLFGLFKNWQMHYMGWMLEYAGEASRGNWAPLLWMQAGTWATAGTAGLPLYGAVDSIQKMFTDESIMKNTYDTFNSDTADAIYMGLPAFLGVSLQSSASAPFADPARDATMLMNFVYLDRLKAIGNMVGGAVEYSMETGEHPINSGYVRDQFVKAFAPKLIYRGMQSVEGDYIRSLNTGRPLVRDVDAFNRALYALGFMPVDAEKTFAVANELWNQTEKKKKLTQFYGEEYAQAQIERDFTTMNRILGQASARGLDVSSILRSSAARSAREESDILESRFKAEQIQEYRSLLGG